MPVGNQLPHGETAQGGPLKRELGERHIRLMALGASWRVCHGVPFPVHLLGKTAWPSQISGGAV